MKMAYLRNVTTLRLDAGTCVGCGRCLEVCPHGVFELAEGKSRIADRDACMECGACARNCPVGALWVKNGVGCAVGILNSALGRKAACCGEDQPCCCGDENDDERLRLDGEKGQEPMSEQNDETTKAAGGACGPGCCCDNGGVSPRMKWVICGVVALAAGATVAAHVSRTRAANAEAKPQGYAVSIPVTAGGTAVQAAPAADPDAWLSPLKGFDELNVVATDTDGVFVVLPSDDAERMAAIQKEVATAAATITARGSRMGRFLLSQEAKEYAALAQQIGTPAVVALCKGQGMVGVSDQQITQDGLLKAFVGASRPSGCGSSGCGPGSSGCGPTAAPSAGCN